MDQFCGCGDLIATSRLSSMLTRIERPYRLRIDAMLVEVAGITQYGPTPRRFWQIMAI